VQPLKDSDAEVRFVGVFAVLGREPRASHMLGRCSNSLVLILNYLSSGQPCSYYEC
jgi:hypothetical protein